MKAFPIQNAALPEENHGMDLRDYFAAKAMQALVTGQMHDADHWHLEAMTAYEIADSMMEARKL
jgi:hypothetical protein